VAILSQFPNISLGLARARDTGNVISMPFDVSLDLPVFDRNRGAIGQERATRQQLYDEYVARVFEARSAMARLVANTQGIEEQLRVAETALPGLQRLVDAYRHAVHVGQADVLSYYTAWNDLASKRQEIIVLRQEMVETRIELETITGIFDLGSVDQAAAAREPDTGEGMQ